MEISADWDSDDFVAYLTEKGLHDDVIAKVMDNRINSAVFLDLTEEDLKELAPAIGDRIALRRILEQARKCREQTNPESEVNGPPRGNGEVSINTCRQPLGEHNSNSTVTEETGSASNADYPVSSSSDWHIWFTIPDLQSFSQHVKDAVKTGVITARARREINQVLRTYMTSHTIRPTSEQYNTVCKKLITKFPKLMDTEGKSKFSSWKLGLRNSFKNFRRGTSKENETAVSPPKRRRLYDSDCEEISEEEYHEAIKELQEAFKSKGKKSKGSQHATVKTLMEKTKMRRFLWIRQEPSPFLSEVIDKFPHLSTSKWLRQEFRAITSCEDSVSSLVDNWIEWRDKLIRLARLESVTRPMIKKLLAHFDECDELLYPEDCKDMIGLELLTKLLYPRGPSKSYATVHYIESSEVDLEDEISEKEQSEPFIVVTSKPGTETSQIFVCCERQIYLESKSMRDALIDMMSTYFVFNIAYPRSLHGILIFLQHHVFNLPDEQTVPAVVKTLLGNLLKL